MSEDGQTLREVYDAAEKHRQDLEQAVSRATTSFQEKLTTTLQLYEQCLLIAERISLFSPNESLEDVSTTDLRYLTINYRLGELRMNVSTSNRKTTILNTRSSYVSYLKQLDGYDILSKNDAKLLEAYEESPDTFSTTGTQDPARRREQKIQRFREEKALKQTLAQLEQNTTSIENEDEAHRRLQLTRLQFCTSQAFQALESIALELHILSLAPPDHAMGDSQPQDTRERQGRNDGYSERLDSPQLSAGLSGPLLDSKGKPLRPFTLFGSKREELRNGVFRPDHSLPTMSIDEYLEEERKRGGIIDGGGPQSGIKPEVDEDDMEAADRATMKAREWDEYVEANPKGSGNTINRG